MAKMKFRVSVSLGLVLFAACTTKVALEENSAPAVESRQYLFAIDGQPTYADEFLYMLNKNASSKSDSLDWNDFEESLELFINFKLKVGHAERLGYGDTEEFRREFETFREDLRKPYLLESSVQDGELQKAYDRLQEIVRASHILLSFPTNASKEDSIAVFRMALKIREEAVSGTDFGRLAIEHSQDPSAQVNRGNLGYFTAMQMVYPFEAATYELRVGEISEPVLSEFGYHLIQLSDRKPNPGEVRVSHLLVRTDPNDPASEDRAVRKVADIYEQLRLESTTWEEIVSNFSEDQSTRQNGGMLPWFGVGSIIPEFEQAAFSLTEIGEISAPVKTDYGFHVIRLEDRKPIPPFEELEPMLKSRILRDSRSTLIKSQVVAMQKAKYQMRENETLAAELSGLLKTWDGMSTSQLDSVVTSQDLAQSELLSIWGEPFRVEGFQTFVKQSLDADGVKGVRSFEVWLDAYTTKLLKDTEERDLVENNTEYRMLLREFREGIMLFSLMNDEVWQKGLLDSVGQQQYYEQHLDRYLWKERVPALIVTLTQENEGEVEKIRRFLANRRYSPELKYQLEDRWLDDFPLLFTLEDRIVEVPGHPVVQKLDLKTAFHELTHEQKKLFVITGEPIAPGPKALNETLGQVIQDYQAHLDSLLVKELRDKSFLHVNEEEKKRIYEFAVN